MRSGSRVSARDLTTVARIRDAAIDRYGRDGFGASLRTIAADAGVSGALIVHHFGSKTGLRSTCDEHVRQLLRHQKAEALGGANATSLLAQMAAADDYAPAALYLIRSLQAGGDLATGFLDGLVADTEQYLRLGVESGTITPSADPHARAALLIRMGIGALMLEATLSPHLLQGGDFRQFFVDYADRWAAPTLELYTDGVLADRTFLDQLRPPEEDTP